MLRFLLRPRWIALTLACLLMLPAFKALSDWQWRRLHQRQAWNALITANSAMPALDVSAVPRPLTPADQWRIVSACGTWDTTRQLLVRNRPFEAHQGFWVTTPLVTDSGTLAIVRGWIAAGASSTDSPSLSAPPTGRVCTESRLRIATPRTRNRPDDLPHGQIDALVPVELGATTLLDGFGELVSSTPDSAAGLTLLPAPELTEGPHRSYALQWLFFMIMTIIGWMILVRTEIQRRSSEN